MKKSFVLAACILSILVLGSMVGCSSSGEVEEDQAKAIDISGDYVGTMTFSKVEIVYDTDEDENGQETRNYYEPEGESDWVGETVDIKYQVIVNEDNTVSLNGIEDDGSIATSIDGAYNEAKNEFYYETEEIGGKNAMTLLFSDKDGILSAKGTMVFTHTETGLVNEIAIDLKKI